MKFNTTVAIIVLVTLAAIAVLSGGGMGWGMMGPGMMWGLAPLGWLGILMMLAGPLLLVGIVLLKIFLLVRFGGTPAIGQTCPHCGRGINPAESYCPHCGQPTHT